MRHYTSWPTRLLSDVCTKIGSGATPRGGKSVYKDSGVAFIRSQNVLDHTFNPGGLAYIDDEAARALQGVTVKPGDVLVNITGDSVARCCRAPTGLDARVSQHVAIIRPRLESLDPRFLAAYLVAPAIKKHLLALAGAGATRPALTKAHLQGLRVPIPPMEMQRAIGGVFGALDDKIECNERVRVSANEIASALLSDLLASAQRDGTLGEGRLRDVATVNTRAVKPGTGTFRYLDISSVGVGHAQEPTILNWCEAPGRARRGVADGDVLWSTVRPNRESHWLVLDPPEDLVVSTGFAVLTPTSVGASFLYGMTERPRFVEYLVAVAEGSAYPAVPAERFLDAPMPLSPAGTVSAYEARTMPLRRRAHAAAEESRVLGRLRDLLLPPLLSGALRVYDVEPLVGEVV